VETFLPVSLQDAGPAESTTPIDRAEIWIQMRIASSEHVRIKYVEGESLSERIPNKSLIFRINRTWKKDAIVSKQLAKEDIEIRPKLNAGSEEEEINIICMNCNGFPSGSNHGLKLVLLNELIKDKDIAVILETGINKNRKIREVTEDHNVTKINFMKDIEREQYQHNGNGTAIFTH